MPDDSILDELRAELARQREESDQKYEALVKELDRQHERDEERDAKPLTHATAAETMARGYAQSGAEQNGGES